IEADEYDRMFLGLCPQIVVLTTLELDHPDMFASLDDVRALFASFVELLPDGGLLIAGTDDAEVSRFAATQADRLRVVRYGLAGTDWGARDIVPNSAGGMDFTALRGGEPAGQVALQVPGTHNVQNALAVLAVAAELGVPFERAAAALGAFSGMGRRFEVRGTARGVTIIDDYAHHPTVIRATLEAARSRYPGAGIWAVWQPHTYSRTRALLDDFAASFGEADHVIITDVYRSRDVETYGIGPEDVLCRMPDHPDARHIGGLADVVAHLAAHVQPGDVVIILSAGDATRVCGDLLDVLGGQSAS
ncbi:MAG TPA: cyanophycin synthetase, partial [Aggregatilineales bacterium]|nr:cyanophycin synthetase [Aggregatilineales bacterium]